MLQPCSSSFAFAPAALLAASVAVASVAFASSARAATFTEGFDAGVPAGWTVTNLSVPLGLGGWVQGNTTLGPAQSGSATSFVVANFNAGSGVATISDWLIMPSLTLNPSSVFSFYTRSAATTFADRLELRFSSVPSVDVGSTAVSVGSFTTLLLAINPELTPTGYPAAWTQFSVAFTSLAAPTVGSIAFRYFVTNGGPSGTNSEIIGLDSVNVTNVGAIPEPSAYALMALGLVALALRRGRA